MIANSKRALMQLQVRLRILELHPAIMFWPVRASTILTQVISKAFADSFSLEAFDNMQKDADKLPPGARDRKKIFCNANAITYMKPDDVLPYGSQPYKKVCKYNGHSIHYHT